LAIGVILGVSQARQLFSGVSNRSPVYLPGTTSGGSWQVGLAPGKFTEAKLRVKTSNICISAPRCARAILTAHLDAQQGQVSNENQ